MSRIGITLSGIERTLLDHLAESNAAATLSALRMTTGHKINHPRDNPGAFAALSGLQRQLSNVGAAMSNTNAASNVVVQTHSALGQIGVQLDAIRTELLKDTGAVPLTDAQRAESQAKIDAAINQVNVLAASDVAGRRTLDGSADFLVSGRNWSQVSDLAVHATGGGADAISGSVTAKAAQAALVYTGTDEDKTTAAATITLSGNRGSTVISVASGQTLSSLADAVNQKSHLTGVTAAVSGTAHTLTLSSVDYGSTASAAIVVTSGAFAVGGGDGHGTAHGVNAAAVINGQTFSASDSRVEGSRFTVNQQGLQFEIQFAPSFLGRFDTIDVSGDALTFALDSDLTHKATLAIPGVQAFRLGGSSGTLDQLQTGGTLAGLGSNASAAIRVVDESLGMLTRVGGSVNGFYNAAISSASSLLGDLQTDLGDAIDAIDKTNDTEETVRQVYCRQLADNATAGLSILAQQRASIVSMIQHLAGLN
jgi:flagellin-like hook-associated protein FlgL